MALEKEGGEYFYQKTESLETIKMPSFFSNRKCKIDYDEKYR